MTTAELRAAVATARSEAESAEVNLANLRSERRTTREARDAARARGDSATLAILAARLQELEAKLLTAGTNLEQAKAWVSASRRKLIRSVDDAFVLTEAGHPLLLLPVRLETRFAWADPKRPTDQAAFTIEAPEVADQQPVLLVRIYPDTVHQDSHEPLLTPQEAQWQNDFRKRLGLARDRIDFVIAWEQLIAKTGPRRAAYIAHTATGKQPGLRSDLWTRATRAACLPDFWFAEARLTSGQLVRAAADLVAWPLETGPDPAGWEDPSAQPTPGGPGMAWMVDFRQALRAGMALRLDIPLAEVGVPTAVERLAVVGARVETDGAGGARTLRGLLDAHHYTDGLWLPAHGTPTNNTPAGRAPSSRPGSADEIFRVEGDMAPLVAPKGLADMPGSAGWQAAALLGVENSTFAHVAGADALTARTAEQIRVLLEFAFIRPLLHLLGAGMSKADTVTLLNFFVDEVPAAGPLPAVRIGDQPYGILPLTQIDPGQQDLVNDGFLNRVAEKLGVLRGRWAEAHVPQIGDIGPAAGDPAVDLLEILRNQETTATVGLRAILGPKVAASVGAVLDPARLADFVQIRSELAGLLSGLGIAGHPDLLELLLTPDVAPVTRTLVQPETEPLPVIQTPIEYFRLLGFERHPFGDFNLTNLAADTDAGYAIAGGRPESLLFEIARLAVLSTADEAARSRLLAGGTVPTSVSDHWDDELTPPAGGWPNSIVERLDWPDPDEPHITVGFRLLARPTEEAAALWVVVRALRELARSETNSAVLESVLRNELGLFWHRLDAWYTAIATRRLNLVRAGAPTGIHLGGFGVVTDLRPKRRLARTAAAQVPAGHQGPVYDDVNNGGYLHAPSLAHATTAAVLRSAHLGHAAVGHGEAFAVNLSSARVRRALQLLDGIAQGQPLAALLGYRIERSLKEAGPDGASAIAPAREAAPVVAGKLTPTATGTASSLVAASNVVDGRRLLELAGFGDGRPVSRTALQSALPTLKPKQVDALVTALIEAGDVLDAAGDLMLAEGVFQLVQGNPARSGAASDALSGTPVPPGEVEVAHTPRHGIGVTQRLAVACPPIDASDLTGDTGWRVSERAKASPVAEAFARSVLPAPTTIRLRAVATFDEDTTAEISLNLATAHKLAAAAGRGGLGFAALDLVFAAPGHQPDNETTGSALELRLLELAGLAQEAKDNTGLHLILARDPAWTDADFDLVQALEIARSLRALLSESRPLRPADLGHPQTGFSHQIEATPVEAALVTARDFLTTLRGDLVTAAAELRAALKNVLSDGIIDDQVADIDPTEVRAALFKADTIGVAQACPDPWHSAPTTRPLPTTVKERVRAALTDLLTRATATLAELDRRLTAETEASAAVRPGPDDPADAQVSGKVAELRERAEAMFGRGFPLAIPLVPSTPGADSCLRTDAQPAGADESNTRQVVARTALVRHAVARLDAVLACAEITTDATPRFVVRQQPLEPGEAWIALPGAALPGGRVSLLAHLPLGAINDGTVAGFLVDEWVEVVPDAEQTTSVAFHYDAPTSAAPNVWLLGVLPPGRETWTAKDAVAYVDEALALAKLRAVGSDAIPVLGQMLPAALGWDLHPNLPGLDVSRLTAPTNP